MTKNQMIEKISKRAHLTKRASSDAVNAVFNLIKENLARGEKTIVTGFGTFYVGKISTKRGRNPRTGQPMQHAAHKLPRFTAGKTIKRLIK